MVAPKKAEYTNDSRPDATSDHVAMTAAESWQIYDDAARRYMGMSGEEFHRAWEAGEIEDPDRPEVMRVYMVYPFARVAGQATASSEESEHTDGFNENQDDLLMTPEEVWEYFDGRARRYAGMSGEEFIRAWDAGKITDPDQPGLIDVAMMVPLVRKD